MGIVILIVLCLGTGGYIGFRLGAYHIRQENIILHKQISLLDNYSRTWAAEASNSYQLSGQVAQQQTNNTSVILNTIHQLLGTIQQQQSHSLNSQEQQKISEIINQARSITSRKE